MSTKHSIPVILLDRRIINDPALVLLGYFALAIVILLSSQTSLRVWLAIILAFFGTGGSTVAVLFSRAHVLDLVERVALSACLSMTLGGLFGFGLARSPWGLNLWPFLTITGLYNLVCYLLILYRQRNLDIGEKFIQLDCRKLILPGKIDQGKFNRIITAALTLVLFGGVWMFIQASRTAHLDPPMTEFYLLGPGRQTESYPKTGHPGETLDVNYGIVNRENQAAAYQIKIFIQGEQVGESPSMRMDPNETQSKMIEFHLPKSISNLVKVDFVLYRGDVPYRFLHLWIDISNP
ncbi:MAG TPA: DUF1616 domain-containing protein [Anaerolineales bacterium]